MPVRGGQLSTAGRRCLAIGSVPVSETAGEAVDSECVGLPNRVGNLELGTGCQWLGLRPFGLLIFGSTNIENPGLLVSIII
jgi:hypothetical protein